MRGVFDDRGVQPAEPQRDTELTLSSTSLLLIVMGLLLLCGLCFGVGYAVGNHGSQEVASVATPVGAESSPAQSDSARPKPSANAQPGPQGAQPDAATDPDGSATSTGSGSRQDTAAATTSGSSSAAANLPSSASGQVRPAFGATLPTATAVSLPATSSVGPALPPAGSVMVQIAAVSEQEDADVLMGALRKRGYAVSAHREALDGLIHVRIGPFKTRDEAEPWRQKLLNDGYNAIVQP